MPPARIASRTRASQSRAGRQPASPWGAGFCLYALIWVSALAGGCDSGGAGSGNESPSSVLLAPDSSAGARLTIAAAGDFGMERAGVATLGAMATSRPDLYLGLGDFSYAGPGSEDDFCELVHSKIGTDAPFEIISGNHEEDSGEDGHVDNVAACLPDRLEAVGEYARQYYFDVGQLVRFIMISPDLTIDGDHYYYGPDDSGGDNPQLAWLEEAIDDARAGQIEWIVVGMHKNCISVGRYYCAVYQDLFSALIASRVDLVLSGHDHTYQRSKQIAARRTGCREVVVDQFDRDCVVADGDTYRKGGGSVFVVSGAGGAELYPVDPNDPEAGYFAAAMGGNTRGNRHGFAMLTISPRRLDVRFVGSTRGSFADRFRIERRTR
jgi:Calcineurin-like phosphoesterase